jgi:tellurite resistance protein
MTKDECTASLRVLLAMVRADGQIHQREKDALEVLAHRSFGMELPSVSTPLDVEAECAKIESAKAKRLTMSAALVIADIDEERDPAETALLERIHAALGYSGDPEGAFVKSAHRARMGLLTMRLTEANAEFFRGVARLSEAGADSFDPAAYERLLEELDAKKTELLTSTF